VSEVAVEAGPEADPVEELAVAEVSEESAAVWEARALPENG